MENNLDKQLLKEKDQNRKKQLATETTQDSAPKKNPNDRSFLLAMNLTFPLTEPINIYDELEEFMEFPPELSANFFIFPKFLKNCSGLVEELE